MIFALLQSVSSHIWSVRCEGVTLTTTKVIWVTVKYARLDPPKPGQHQKLSIRLHEDFTYLISEAVVCPVSPACEGFGCWKEEYLPLCDLISKIRETYQYVNIGENRERGTWELNWANLSYSKLYNLKIVNVPKDFDVIYTIFYIAIFFVYMEIHHVTFLLWIIISLCSCLLYLDLSPKSCLSLISLKS